MNENTTECKILKNFFVFEGIDGSGTSTQLKLLKEQDKSGKLIITAEPTGGETGRFLRRMLAGEFSVCPQTAAYLFAADRCEHIYGKDGIMELTKQGNIVVSDRYIFSSLAYQSVSCGELLPKLLNSTFPLPEILFYFCINPEISLERVNKRGEAKEIYEKIDYQKKTAALYESVISQYEKESLNSCDGQKMKIVRIDAEKSIEEIEDIIRGAIYGEHEC